MHTKISTYYKHAFGEAGHEACLNDEILTSGVLVLLDFDLDVDLPRQELLEYEVADVLALERLNRGRL